ncbi:carboxymuconolactone decarboxylase family protein [Clostridium beijerinckii]|jgi:alkylhydroperoxidase/carboxymuconolactone decarboxylase family protein YurZ|uniref:Carboxymuconolactone decarboxylase family protein n=2 Tax=Clostridium beijerinckii TaxID=1520 RepID=A0A1S8NSJ5_CLOBE|nr:carboxymuconolactone decarboxylase family protein [Clostridium beijerinckii]MBC2459979.1 carboxymuconolactone decarboxylase family protein [Clostridium beijerinckii]MBC2477492.1 carboxymuconolactone decarboxylase family protein [Clostridium beijerinckii]MCI1581240.1 carboxymuconolactone decarboxylase family protein [Clostridium beijerinckii]MCI1624694.1 carboxymuconolactone decarboxylase family protein [Clostridium beijerinckii]MDG5852332.1 carboxymuconolactone decarboxylase family protein 
MSDVSSVSNAFKTFMKEAPEYQEIWMETVQKLDSVSKLDSKTEELAYIAVLASSRLEGGLPFHVKHAKSLGATREEIISAVLIGLPAVGNIVIQSLPIAINAYDGE